ncbi:MAG: ABC transporter ATP-binding protein [Peptoniphilaceae bacterium]
MKILKVKNISKSYNKKIIEDINIHLNEGEVISLLGLSGVGKSTLFNIISGVVSPDSGRVILQNEDITNKPGKISYMLQKDLLLEQKTIIKNVSLPLLIKNKNKKEAENIAQKYFEMFGLKGTEKFYPKELSGGMRQRAAFLRTYLASQNVVLLDEPFSSLDAITKNELYNWYIKTSKELKLSTIFITHDIDEAINLSDRIYIMIGSPGKIKNEIIINRNDTIREKFNLTNDFLEYKKEILEILNLE